MHDKYITITGTSSTRARRRADVMGQIINSTQLKTTGVLKALWKLPQCSQSRPWTVNRQDIIKRPKNDWKFVTYLTWSESIVPRSRMSTNWNDPLTASGPLWVTRLLNVPLASVVSVYALALMLETDILTFEHNVVIRMMWYDTCDFWETITVHAVA